MQFIIVGNNYSNNSNLYYKFDYNFFKSNN